MNKKEFTKYIDEQLEGKTLEQQIKMLRKIQNEYLPDLIHQRQKKLGLWIPPKEEDKYMLCDKCKKYSLIKRCKHESCIEVRTETTYIDSGYGDGDMMGDVEYFVMYITCPICGHKQEKCKLYKRKLREWNRREGKK